MDHINVILVDDEKAFLDTLTKRLVKRGVRIKTAYSGKSALDLLDVDDTAEVVVLDVKMPEMDGIETLKQIKSRFPLVEVIMLTGHATVETAIDGMKLGAFDYLMKPCDIDVLIEKARNAAQKKRLHEEKIMTARMNEVLGRMI